MTECDYVMCAMPLTAETKGFMNEAVFSSAKEGSVFINVGRGPVVDEEALIRALKTGGRMRGAALDVFAKEPLPEDHELWEMPNVLLSPHNADLTATFLNEAVGAFVHEGVPAFLAGKPLPSQVDASRGY